jgi:hypothetical protein
LSNFEKAQGGMNSLSSAASSIRDGKWLINKLYRIRYKKWTK